LRRADQFVAKVKKELWVLRGKTLAVWGLAFKPETDDVRFAPALNIIRRLLAEGARIRAYDPQAMQKAKDELPEITYCLNHYEAAQNADAILVLTEWDEFRRLKWEILAKSVAHPLLIDGRNLYLADEVTANGFQYVCIGKEPSAVRYEHLQFGGERVPAPSGIAPLAPPAHTVAVQPRP
jgi:UDPglucose 6-dehydrogenase